MEQAQGSACPKPVKQLGEIKKKKRYNKLHENLEEAAVKPLNDRGKGEDERK